MRKTLQEFYTPTSAEFASLWNEAFFALDANVLLDVYRYSPATTNQLIDVLAKLGDRVWVPHQAAIEYQRNRLGVRATVLEAYDKAALKLDSALQDLKDALRKNAESASLLDGATKAIDAAKKKLEGTKARHDKLVPGEKLHDRLTDLLDGKVGPPYTAPDLAAKHKVAEERFKNRVPPGYRDAAKPEPERYGDAVVWFQLLDHAKATQKPMVLVTADTKEDWWWQERGRTQGPRPELRREMMIAANMPFYMYAPERFLEHARRYLGSEVTDEAIEEAREVQATPEVYSTVSAWRTAMQSALAATDTFRGLEASSMPASAYADILRHLQAPPSSAYAEALRNVELAAGPQRYAEALRNLQLSSLSANYAEALRHLQSPPVAESYSDKLRGLLSAFPEQNANDAQHHAGTDDPHTVNDDSGNPASAEDDDPPTSTHS